MRSLFPEITEQDIVAGWEKHGTGKPLEPAYVTWLAKKLNENTLPQLPAPSYKPMYGTSLLEPLMPLLSLHYLLTRTGD
jgi:hypothetical protein